MEPKQYHAAALRMREIRDALDGRSKILWRDAHTQVQDMGLLLPDVLLEDEVHRVDELFGELDSTLKELEDYARTRADEED